MTPYERILLLERKVKDLQKRLCCISSNPEDNPNLLQSLVDDTTTTWDYSVGNIAEWTIEGNNTLEITNLPGGVSFGVIKIVQGTAGGFIPILPGNSLDVSYRLDEGDVNLLGFYFDGTVYHWSSSYSGEGVAPDDPLTEITFSGTLTESPSGTWSSASPETFSIASETMLADGRIQLDYTGANSQFVIFGLDDDPTENAFQAAGVADWNFSVFTNGSDAILMYAKNENAGALIDPSMTIDPGNLLSLNRVGTTVTVEKSIDGGDSWVVVYTFSDTTSATLYIKAEIYTAGKLLVNPKGEGIV